MSIDENILSLAMKKYRENHSFTALSKKHFLQVLEAYEFAKASGQAEQIGETLLNNTLHQVKDIMHFLEIGQAGEALQICKEIINRIEAKSPYLQPSGNVWLDDPRTKIMLAGWGAIQESLHNEAVQGHIRGWNIQPIPEAVKAQHLWEGLQPSSKGSEG